MKKNIIYILVIGVFLSLMAVNLSAQSTTPPLDTAKIIKNAPCHNCPIVIGTEPVGKKYKQAQNKKMLEEIEKLKALEAKYRRQLAEKRKKGAATPQRK
ncbi:MAG: hypothetical protein ACPGXZ_00770 [Saprospiraceae bacterium]